MNSVLRLASCWIIALQTGSNHGELLARRLGALRLAAEPPSKPGNCYAPEHATGCL